MAVKDRFKTCLEYGLCLRCLGRGHNMKNFTCRHSLNGVTCGSKKHHQFMQGSSSRLVNLVQKNVGREDIK